MTVVFNSKLLVKRIQFSFVNCLLCDVKSKRWQTSREPISLQCLRVCHVNSCEPCSSGASFKGLKDWFLFMEWEIRVRFPVEHLKYKPGCAISQFWFLTGFVWMFTVSIHFKTFMCVCVVLGKGKHLQSVTKFPSTEWLHIIEGVRPPSISNWGVLHLEAWWNEETFHGRPNRGSLTVWAT